jgi:hypothetical protein
MSTLSSADASANEHRPPGEPEEEGIGRGRDLVARVRRRQHVVIALVLAGVAAIATMPKVAGGDRRAALAATLKKRGLILAPEDAQWIDKPKPIVPSHARAIVRAAPSKGEPNDLFLVDTELSPEGVLLKVGEAYNLTETSSADESRPVVHGEKVAYVARPTISEGTPTVHVLDLATQPEVGRDWSRAERFQNAVTNWQQTGQLRGVGKRTFQVDAKDVSVDLDASALTIHAGGKNAQIALVDKPPLPAWVKSEEPETARPGTLTQWAVDRVRSIPWIGDDNMQTVKAVAFTALDFILRNKEQVTGDTGAKSIAEDLGKTELEPATRTLPVDPEIGWPPSPIDPWVTPELPGEGQWHPLDKDPFVRRIEGLPPAFLTTFVRSDRTRKATRVYIALWDPRQVELHMMAGTVEPKGATGEAGPGFIPRSPEVMKRVVAASNAGFQALHGEFGMMADGVVYLPPKEYGATVAVTRDGTTGFGTWPGNQQIPEGILSYRQNMTVMVQDQKFNPYGRTWWGGTPPGWEDKTHTVRTGICLTKERFIGYFYGADLSPDALAQAMILARCSFGIALDMNAGHSGLEFYKVGTADEMEHDPIGRALSGDWEAEGDLPGLDGWKFRGRRLIKGMGLMHFPRYIKREGRDFFYMTLRHVLPGPNIPTKLKPAFENEGVWQLKGLPQHGFPYAMALAEVRPDASRPDRKVRVLRIDPRTIALGGAPKKEDQIVLVADPGDKAEGASIWFSQNAFSVADKKPAPDAARIAFGAAIEKTPSPASAAIGVNDEEGMLVYADLGSGLSGGSQATPGATSATAADAKMLDALLKSLGCGQRLMLAAPLALALGGDTDLAGQATRAPNGSSAVRLLRTVAPGAKRIFEDTPVVPLSVWYPLQQHRIRYFKKPQGSEDAVDEK